MTPEQKEEILKTITELSQFDIDRLKREEKDFNFVAVNELVKRTILAAARLKQEDAFLHSLPNNKLNLLKQKLLEFLIQVRSIQNFNPTSYNSPSQQQTAIIQKIEEIYAWLYDNFFTQFDAYTVKRDLNAESIEDELKKIRVQQNEINKISVQASDALLAIKSATGDVGALKFSGIFDEQAAKHRNLAIAWLFFTALAVYFMGDYLIKIFSELHNVLLNGSGEDKNIPIQIFFQLMISKLLLLSFFSLAFYQIIKNFNANMHLYTLNKHRSNCLLTFQSFYESSFAPNIKDAVLIQATKAVFEAGDSGFVSVKDATFNSLETIKILDQVKKE